MERRSAGRKYGKRKVRRGLKRSGSLYGWICGTRKGNKRRKAMMRRRRLLSADPLSRESYETLLASFGTRPIDLARLTTESARKITLRVYVVLHETRMHANTIY
jgi:hypothetical protein